MPGLTQELKGENIMRKEIKKKNQNESSEYKEARKKWSCENAELFLNTLTKVGEETGAELTPMDYVRAYKLCVEKYQFGYPAEFKIAELISTDDSYEQALAIMEAVMKQFRIAFWKEWRKRKDRKKAQGKKAA